MILASDIVSTLQSRLDAERTDYYNFQDNFKEAINESVKFIVSLIDSAVEQNKFTTEVLYPLQKALVIHLSKHSRFTFDDTRIWAIRSINPLPKTEPNISVIPIEIEETGVSVERPDLIHIYSGYECMRLTKEEWEVNAGNPFKPGNIIMKCSTLLDGSRDNVKFAYLNPYNYGSYKDGEPAYQVSEIEIRPYIPLRNITLFYVERPSDIETESDVILLHNKLYNFLTEKCLQYIAYSQGDGTSVFQLSTNEINTIVNLLK